MIVDIVFFLCIFFISISLIMSLILSTDAALLIWRHRDAIEIHTRKIPVDYRNDKRTKEFKIYAYETVYLCKIKLPNNDYIQWYVDNTGNPKIKNKAISEIVNCISYWKLRVLSKNSVLPQTNNIMDDLTFSRPKCTKVWRISFVVAHVIRKVLDEKLVLHKLQE